MNRISIALLPIMLGMLLCASSATALSIIDPPQCLTCPIDGAPTPEDCPALNQLCRAGYDPDACLTWFLACLNPDRWEEFCREVRNTFDPGKRRFLDACKFMGI